MGPKSTSATSGNQGFLLWGAQFTMGLKTTSAMARELARWAPVIILVCIRVTMVLVSVFSSLVIIYTAEK